MDLQDEHDRDQTHLYGLNETHFTVADFLKDQSHFNKLSNSKNKANLLDDQIAIKLNEDCLQCNNLKHNQNPSHIKMLHTAFKMACINYKSSNIIFRGKNLTRKSLMEVRTNLLEEEWQNIL